MLYRILPQILNMSLTGSIVILCVLLGRLLLKKAPKIFSYALWGIVLFRLLCPIALTSDYSLMQFMRFADARVSSHTSAAEYISQDLIEQFPDLQQTIDHYPAQDPTAENAAAQDPSLENPSSSLLSTQPEDRSEITPTTLTVFGTSLWMTGILTLLSYSLLSLHKLRRQLIGAIPLRDNIYLADHITSPFVLGVLHPRIYLPSSLPKEQQLYILLHEQHHIHRLDHIFKLLAFAALCLHWFNPLVWLAFFLSGKDMEMSCDEAVLRQMGDSIRADYSSSLLSLATGHRILAGSPLAFGEGNTKDRIRNVLDWKKPRTWIIGAALLLCSILALSLMTNPSRSPNFAGARYRVEQILYDAPQYSFTYTVDTAPQFTITSDYVLMTRSSTYDVDTWHSVGALREAEYSRQQLYSLFDPLYCTAHEQLDKVTVIYRVDPINVSAAVFFLVMETYDGDVMLAQGYGNDENSHVRWLFALEKQSSAYDIDAMSQTLKQEYGTAAEYFALYECDTNPGSLLLGFRQEEEVGYAVFTYDSKQDDYILQHSDLLPYSVTGLYSAKLPQDENFDTNLQIILSSRDDLAAVRISSLLQSSSDFHSMKEVTGSGSPDMLVFECPDTITLNNLHIEYIYQGSNDWIHLVENFRSGIYTMLPESDEEIAFLPTLQLQADHWFFFSYDPLSSYIGYGIYLVKDGILTAVTADGHYQYRFEIVDETTLRFLQEGSSDVSLIDDRIGTEVKDQAIFQR